MSHPFKNFNGEGENVFNETKIIPFPEPKKEPEIVRLKREKLINSKKVILSR